jgi:hypothetical protein
VINMTDGRCLEGNNFMKSFELSSGNSDSLVSIDVNMNNQQRNSQAASRTEKQDPTVFSLE